MRLGAALGVALAFCAGCNGRTLEAFPQNFVGVGVELTIKDRFPVVVRALAGSPAEEMGLAPGDRLVVIDGESTEGWTLAQAVDRLRGPQGTQVTVQVSSAGGAVTKLMLTRRPLALKPAAKR
jgi:carboxyl-terminal processing protease